MLGVVLLALRGEWPRRAGSSTCAFSHQSFTALYHLPWDICFENPSRFSWSKLQSSLAHQPAHDPVSLWMIGTTSHSISQNDGVVSHWYFWTCTFTFSWSHPPPHSLYGSFPGEGPYSSVACISSPAPPLLPTLHSQSDVAVRLAMTCSQSDVAEMKLGFPNLLSKVPLWLLLPYNSSSWSRDEKISICFI